MVGDANPGNRGQRIRYLFPKQQLGVTYPSMSTYGT